MEVMASAKGLVLLKGSFFSLLTMSNLKSVHEVFYKKFNVLVQVKDGEDSVAAVRARLVSKRWLSG